MESHLWGSTLPDRIHVGACMSCSLGKQKASLKPNPICRAEEKSEDRDKRKYQGEQGTAGKKVPRLTFFLFFSLFLFFTAACKGRQKGCRMDHGINILCLLETLVMADGDSSYARNVSTAANT